jgi:hypothetical protein
VHLGIYEFDGDPKQLLVAYDALMERMPPAGIEWHLCAVRPDGITIYDTCPSEEVFRRFSASPEFAAALRGAGLPEPRVTGRAVHAARVGAQAGG